MKISNFALELAEARSEQERETAIASASKAIGRVGRGPCVDCRRDISAKRPLCRTIHPALHRLSNTT